MTINIKGPELRELKPRILVLGVGGAGGNAINEMIENNMQGVEGVCMPAYEWPEKFNTMYDCLTFGYEESHKKIKEIGRAEVNKHEVYIRFSCTPVTMT